MAISPVRLNHAVLFVADLDRSLRFYTDVFGMEVVAREPRANAAFLRLPRSGNHHDLGLFGVGPAGGPKRLGAIGLYHLAWQLDTIDELAAARHALLDAGAYTGESSHGATKSLYGADPDGNEFELMWMLPREEWGPFEHAAPIDPLDLAGEVRRWEPARRRSRHRRGGDRRGQRCRTRSSHDRGGGRRAGARRPAHPATPPRGVRTRS
jgi:catechol-2,3-dioxygenase